ncbi:MAG: phosphocholine cytidylyltransferase family protein [Candidatus Aminicenantales bacterium]
MAEKDHLAVVLCAGRGGRLRPLTDDRPKCLLRVGGKDILGRCLDDLIRCGIEETVLVTGYKADMVESFVRMGGWKGVRFTANPDFASTNTAVSFHLALRDVRSGVILINGDVLFDPALLADLIASPEANGLVIDREIALNAEEIKVVARDGRVVQIGKDIEPAECAGEAIGIYKIGRETVPDLLRVYETLESRGERRHYFEKGFEMVCGEGRGRTFGLVGTDGRPWVEIDTPEDFAHAERHVAPRLEP